MSVGLTVGSARSDSPLNDVCSVYDSLGAIPVIATPITVLLDVELIPSSDTYTIANGEVTVHTTGAYEIVGGVSILSTAGNRTQAQSWIERNGDELGGTRMLHYCRQANHGASGSLQVYVLLTEGDVIRLRSQRTEGTGTIQTLAGGSRLALRRL